MRTDSTATSTTDQQAAPGQPTGAAVSLPEPDRGGSYTRDPATGALTRTGGPQEPSEAQPNQE